MEQMERMKRKEIKVSSSAVKSEFLPPAAASAAARPSVSFVGLDAVAIQLDNGHGGTGVSEFHLRKVLKGDRESEFLLNQIRERFPQLLPANGMPWNKANQPK